MYAKAQTLVAFEGLRQIDPSEPHQLHRQW